MTRFMTLDFADGDGRALLDRVVALARGPYTYVVTPNVDHLTKLLDGRIEAEVYRGADLAVCDSRILNHLARLKGKRLSVYPGSDLTADLLASDTARSLTIAVFGPDRAAFDQLVMRYPEARLVFLEAPVLTPDTPGWRATVQRVAGVEWDILLDCISFPKQERFAHALRAAGRSHGVALCVGASVDFLTGRQQRAPRWVQRMSMEWLYRLLSQPRRMFRRYVVEGPAILGWFARIELFGSR